MRRKIFLLYSPCPIPTIETVMESRTYIDESPIRFDCLHRTLPNWLKRFLPTGGGNTEDDHGKTMFGFTVFLLSESIIFLGFFFTYIALRSTHSNWLPPSIERPELPIAVIINTVVFLSSSLVIQVAENALKRHKINKFRWLWLATPAIGLTF